LPWDSSTGFDIGDSSLDIDGVNTHTPLQYGFWVFSGRDDPAGNLGLADNDQIGMGNRFYLIFFRITFNNRNVSQRIDFGPDALQHMHLCIGQNNFRHTVSPFIFPRLAFYT
jgi:hypothetical protein